MTLRNEAHVTAATVFDVSGSTTDFYSETHFIQHVLNGSNRIDPPNCVSFTECTLNQKTVYLKWTDFLFGDFDSLLVDKFTQVQS